MSRCSACAAFLLGIASAACGVSLTPQTGAVPRWDSNPAPPSPELEAEPGPAAFVHAPSGMQFPEQLDDFVLRSVDQYDTRGRQVSGEYVHPVGIVLVVSVLPTRESETRVGTATHTEFLRAASQLLERSSRTVAEHKMFWRLTGTRHAGDGLGLQAVSFDSPAYDAPTDATELLYVFTSGPWHLEFRATFRRAYGKMPRRQVERFIEHLAWPSGVLL